MRLRTGVILGLLTASSAGGHPKGFHKRLMLQSAEKRLDVVVVMDLDGGERTQLLRASMDLNGDGVLGKEERAQLKARLASLATGRLKVSISGYPLPLTARESKLDLRGDVRAGEAGLSVAVLLEAAYPERPSPGMELSVTDESPDDSHIHLTVTEGETGQVAEQELTSGGTVLVPLSLK